MNIKIAAFTVSEKSINTSFFSQYSKGHNSETMKEETIIFVWDTLFDLTYISIKHHEEILKVTYGQMDGQMDSAIP